MTTLPLADTIKTGLLASGWHANRLERDAFPGVLTLCYHGVRKSTAEDGAGAPDSAALQDSGGCIHLLRASASSAPVLV
jgi:hypothetical protein